jgi:hypothetical protein
MHILFNNDMKAMNSSSGGDILHTPEPEKVTCCTHGPIHFWSTSCSSATLSSLRLVINYLGLGGILTTHAGPADWFLEVAVLLRNRPCWSSRSSRPTNANNDDDTSSALPVLTISSLRQAGSREPNPNQFIIELLKIAFIMHVRPPTSRPVWGVSVTRPPTRTSMAPLASRWPSYRYPFGSSWKGQRA